jgi:hypothetical protein
MGNREKESCSVRDMKGCAHLDEIAHSRSENNLTIGYLQATNLGDSNKNRGQSSMLMVLLHSKITFANFKTSWAFE